MKTTWKQIGKAKRQYHGGLHGAAASALRGSASVGKLHAPAAKATAIAQPRGAVKRNYQINDLVGNRRLGAAQNKPELPEATAPQVDDRARRLAILRQTAGMWKDRTDIPKDGLQYQLEARAEWD
jgi:hypothetical protein